MLTAPASLNDQHQTATFESGVASLDDWLKRRAAANQVSGASRTFVVCEDGPQVVAYCALASSTVASTAAPGWFRRNKPDPIPVVVLGLLAIALTHQRRGLGRALFQDAARRVLHASEGIGIRGMLEHALSDNAKAFYVNLGNSNPPPGPDDADGHVDRPPTRDRTR